MVMKRKIWNLLLVAVIFISAGSCRKSPEGPTDIRIRNLSDKIFENVFVDTSAGEYNYGTIQPGEVTDYHRYDKAYREAHITLNADGVAYEILPVDYTYEIYLGRGKFTYEVNLADTVNHTLSIHVIAEAPLD